MEKLEGANRSHSNFIRSNSDLNIINYGHSELASGQEVCEARFFHNILYCISKGKACVTVNGNRFSVAENDIFLLPASYLGGFVSDIESPASFYWISFWGFKAKHYLDTANLTVYRPVFSCLDNSIKDIMRTLVDECEGHSEQAETKSLGYLYLILSELLTVSNRKFTNRQFVKNRYAQEAVEYIRNNHMNDINVSDISKHVALNRTYFSSLFKEVIGISPIDYLIKYRIDQSIILMANPLLSIGEIASLVGFNDLVSFSIRFKSVTDQSPSDYRKQLFEQKVERHFRIAKTPDKN